MNIFEQYGIKEVANVTLYAIELDKYDNEIYIPIMYFDTLKVSTIEQTASSTSARGGIGNPQLITWDYGKDIVVSLEDALYTPASQSLMWGGKFGIKKTKIYGVWNPYVYPVDKYGRTKYIERITMSGEPTKTIEGWRFLIKESKVWQFIDSNDNNIVSMVETDPPEQPNNPLLPESGWEWAEHTYIGQDSNGGIIARFYPIKKGGAYRLLKETYSGGAYTPANPVEPVAEGIELENADTFICPCDGELMYLIIEPQPGYYKYYHDGKPRTEDQLEITEYNCPSDNIIYESEEISRAVGKYTLSGNQLENIEYWKGHRPERAIISVDSFGQFQYHAYEFVSSDDPEDTPCYYHDIDFCDDDVVKCTDEPIDAYGYIWENSDLKMTSLEGTQDLYLLKDTDLRYRIRVDNGLREVSLEYHSDTENNYQPKIDVYKNIAYTIKNQDGIVEEKKIKVLVGSFYIIDDWNLNGAAPQEFIYEIESGLENVNYLERMEECQAPKTFAIDADKNIRCSNYRYDRDYDTTELTVFINPKTMKPYEPNSTTFIRSNGEQVSGNLTIIKQGEKYYKWTRSKAPAYTSLGYQIIVDAEHYPGNYRLVGETYSRAYSDGQDQRYQFEIPLCKLSPETKVTLSAEGEPTTFAMNFQVLRRDDGVMMKLTQYNVENRIGTGSTNVVPIDGIVEDKEVPEYPEPSNRIVTKRGDYDLRNPQSTLAIISPNDDARYRVDLMVDEPFEEEWPYIEKATDTELEKIIDNWRVSTLYPTTTTEIYNEALKLTVNLDEYRNKAIVKDTTVYDRYQEIYDVSIDVYGNETEVPNSRRYEPAGIVTSIRFLSAGEYAFDVEGGEE